MTPPDGASPSRDVSSVPFKPLAMKGPDVSVERRADGSIVITSNHAPGEGPRSIAYLIARKAAEHPDRPYIKQRQPNHGPWPASPMARRCGRRRGSPNGCWIEA